jgi:hypothetical protein
MYSLALVVQELVARAEAGDKRALEAEAAIKVRMTTEVGPYSTLFKWTGAVMGIAVTQHYVAWLARPHIDLRVLVKPQNCTAACCCRTQNIHAPPRVSNEHLVQQITPNLQRASIAASCNIRTQQQNVASRLIVVGNCVQEGDIHRNP